MVLLMALANSPSDNTFVFFLRANETMEEIGFILLRPFTLSYSPWSK